MSKPEKSVYFSQKNDKNHSFQIFNFSVNGLRIA